MADDVVRLVDIKYTTSGSEQAAAANKRVSDSLGDVGVQSEKTSRATLSVEKSYESLQRRVDTTYRAQQQQMQAQKTLDSARGQGLVSDQRYAQLQGLITQNYNNTVAAAGNAGKATAAFGQQAGFARHELINLSRQVQDVVVSLGSGQGLGTVILQQGSQIVDVAATSQGSLKGLFSQIIEGAGRVLTPMRLVSAGAVGIGAAALYFGNSWQEAAAEVDRALTGIGQRSGTTAADVNAFTKANSSAVGLSISQARDVALEFAKTGNVSIANLKGVGDAVRGYSLLTGKDATEATKTFADAVGGDLVKGLLQIDQRYNALNAGTIQYIRTLVDQNEKTRALQVYIDAIAPANQRAAESVGVITRAWQGFKNVVSNIASGPAPTSLQDQLAGLQRQRSAAESTKSVGVTPGGYLNTSVAYGGKAQELAELDRQIAAVQTKINEFNAGAMIAQLNAISKEADSNVRAILPQLDAIGQLDRAIRNIQEAQAKGVAPVNSESALAVLQYQRDLLSEQLDTTILQAQVVSQLQADWGGVSAQTATALTQLQGQLAVAQQVTGAAQMQVQAETTINNLLMQGVSLFEAQAIAAKQLEVAQAAATSSVLKQVEALKDQNALLKVQGTADEGRVKAAIAYKNAIDSGADETSAAALQAETLKHHMLSASSAAGGFASNMASAAAAAHQAAIASAAAEDAAAKAANDKYRAETTTHTGVTAIAGPYWKAYLADERLKAAGIQTGSRDMAKALTESIDNLTDATKENTSALNAASINPLYGGRGALAVGYYKAAKGFHGVVSGGIPGIDSVPINILAQKHEEVIVKPVGQSMPMAANSNKPASHTTIINQMNNFSGGSGSNQRLSERQLAQGFGQIAAAVGRPR